MRSSASSTGITAVLYLAPRSGGARAQSLPGLAEERLVLGEEAPAAQHEQSKEAGGDQDFLDSQGGANPSVQRGEHDQDMLDEDRGPSEEQDHGKDLVASRRAAREPLEEV